MSLVSTTCWAGDKAIIDSSELMSVDRLD